MKKWFISALLTAFAAHAFAAAPTPQGAAAEVEQQSAQILGELQAGKGKYQSNPAVFESYINSNVVPHFALDKMAELVLGRHLQQVKAAGKFDAFRDAFRNLLIRAYSKSWASYTNAQIKVLGTPVVDKYNRATVRTVVTNNGKSNNVSFMLWWDGSQWKFYDATFSNVSILTSYRNTFDSELQNGGADALIAKMQNMN